MSSPQRPQRPGFPAPRGEFEHLAPQHFRTLVRRAQGYTAKQTAAEFSISNRTVSAYLERASERIKTHRIEAEVNRQLAELLESEWTFGGERDERRKRARQRIHDKVATSLDWTIQDSLWAFYTLYAPEMFPVDDETET